MNLDRTVRSENAYLGAQNNLLTALSLVGGEGLSEPLLTNRR
jgi:hypothetical protein